MSTIVKPFTFSADTTAYSSQVNANFDGVYAAVNGQLDSSNINVGRGIGANFITSTGSGATGAFQPGNYAFSASSSGTIPLAVSGVVGQIVPLQTWSSNSGIVASIDATGNLTASTLAVPTLTGPVTINGNATVNGQVNSTSSSTANASVTAGLTVPVVSAPSTLTLYASSVVAMTLSSTTVTVPLALNATGGLTSTNANFTNVGVSGTIGTGAINTANLTSTATATLHNVTVANINATSGMTTPILVSSTSSLELGVNNTTVAAYLGAASLSLPAASSYISLGTGAAGNSFYINGGFSTYVAPVISNDTTGGILYQCTSASLGHRWFKYDGTTLTNLATLDTSGNFTANGALTVNGTGASTFNGQVNSAGGFYTTQFFDTSQGAIPPWMSQTGSATSIGYHVVTGQSNVTTSGGQGSLAVVLSGNAVFTSASTFAVQATYQSNTPASTYLLVTTYAQASNSFYLVIDRGDGYSGSGNIVNWIAYGY